MNNQYKATKFVYVEGEEIKICKDYIMTLGLGNKSLLIIEKLFGEPLDFYFISSKINNNSLKSVSKSKFEQKNKIENEKYELNEEEKYILYNEHTPIMSNQIFKWTVDKIDNQSTKKQLSSIESSNKISESAKYQLI